MLEFARWKYILVAAVMLLALVLALPNFFGEDLALQIARKDRTAIDAAGQQAVATLLHERGVPAFVALALTVVLLLVFQNPAPSSSVVTPPSSAVNTSSTTTAAIRATETMATGVEMTSAQGQEITSRTSDRYSQCCQLPAPASGGTTAAPIASAITPGTRYWMNSLCP